MSNPNTLTAPIKLKERKSAASRVVDPLEGVMPGETRHARLVNFQNTVLSAIWPRPTAHGSHNSGEYGDDLHRQARHDEGDLSGFTHFGPFNRDIRNIDPAELENVVSVIGPDYVRVRSVPPQLLDSDNTIIPTGGSCIIETWGMRTTTELRNAV
ncbi:hypothetical protein HY214_00145, partial [Candidatus Roizmanbacteria bacterium]|nr:hypothetical protein [Candidatus Roizmanbacteria bacterium]